MHIFSDNLLEIAVNTVSEFSFRYIEKTRHSLWIINFLKPTKPGLSCARDEHLTRVIPLDFGLIFTPKAYSY